MDTQENFGNVKRQLTSMKHSIPTKIALFYISAQPGLTMYSQADYTPVSRGGDGVTEMGMGVVPPRLPEEQREAQPCIHDKRLN